MAGSYKMPSSGPPSSMFSPSNMLHSIGEFLSIPPPSDPTSVTPRAYMPLESPRVGGDFMNSFHQPTRTTHSINGGPRPDDSVRLAIRAETRRRAAEPRMPSIPDSPATRQTSNDSNVGSGNPSESIDWRLFSETDEEPGAFAVRNVRLMSPSRHFTGVVTPRPRCYTEGAAYPVDSVSLASSHNESTASAPSDPLPKVSLLSPRRGSANAISVQVHGSGSAAVNAATTGRSERRMFGIIPRFPVTWRDAQKKKRMRLQFLSDLEQRKFASYLPGLDRWPNTRGISVAASHSLRVETNSEALAVTSPPVPTAGTKAAPRPRESNIYADTGGVQLAPLRRSMSFNGMTEYQALMSQQVKAEVSLKKLGLARAKEEAHHVGAIVSLISLILLEAILVLGYVAYRSVACPLLQWQCENKLWSGHYDDATALLTIGGVLFATGPTVTSNLTLQSLIMYICGLFTFGALGELPFMFNSLVGISSWQPPAIALYITAFAFVGGMVIYSFWISRSRYEMAVSLLVLVGLVAMYSSAFIVALSAGVSVAHVTYHPHHYMIAWTLCLLFRNPTDPPSILARWVLMGICTQGLSAYSAASMVSQ